MRPLSENERKTLVRLLNKIVERAAALDEPPAAVSAGAALSEGHR